MNANEIAREQATSTWQNDPRRAPAPQDGEEVLYDEPGRIVYRPKELARYEGEGTDCRSHWFRIVRQGLGGRYFLLVQHGGGEQRVSLGYNYRNYAAMFDPLTSDARFWLMWQMLELHNEAKREAEQETAHKYQKAFAEGRLKKRKMPARRYTKVWIEDAN